jgi:tetratricopeptide (TPR) repeat protein|tara:strand:+ start:256 stop:684 length:429 start_codon:yes stop_codon:yes gene_type:complete
MVRKITELEKVPIQQSEVEAANHFFKKAFNFYQEKKYAESVACYDKVIKLVPTHHSAWFNKANGLAQLCKYEEALTCYNVAIKLDPSNGSFWTNKGIVHILQKKYSEADVCFEESIRLDPSDEIAQKYRTVLEKKQRENTFV